MSLLRRLFCSHAFIERGTFRRDGHWWVTLVCGKCVAVKREPLLGWTPMPMALSFHEMALLLLAITGAVSAIVLTLVRRRRRS